MGTITAKSMTQSVSLESWCRMERGAHDWNRTSDLLLTKEVLYRLSYVSVECCLLPIVRWSGRRESNPHNQLGRLRFYH